MNRTLVVLATVLALAGCQASQPEQAATTTTAPTAAFTTSVAKHQDAIREAGSDYTKCTLSLTLIDDHPEDQDEAEDCVGNAVAGRSAMQAIGDDFAAAGEPPTDLSELVARMKRAAEAIRDAKYDVNGSCVPADHPIITRKCQEAVSTFDGSAEKVLVPELDKWASHLG